MNTELLKQTFKDALVEVLHGERESLRDVLAEVVEDLALTEAIRDGQSSALVDREAVSEILESKG